MLLTLTSLYALALGLNSYFGLKQILDTGKEDLGTLKGYVTQFRAELREKYPELADLDGNLRRILRGIDLMFREGRNWAAQYAALTSPQRERIRMAEMRMAGLEVFQLGELTSMQDRVIRVYQGLGRFYSSKYQEEKQECDWERGSLYFDIAKDLGSAKPSADLMKDLGVHLTEFEQVIESRIGPWSKEEAAKVEMLRTQAEQAFRDALIENPLEPGALFGLGWIFLRRAEYEKAIDHYRKLTTITTWADGDRQKYLEDAYINQAECCSLAASAESDEHLYDKALELLKKSRDVAIYDRHLASWQAHVREERDAGDLRKLQTAKPEELAQLLA
ncbi:MAG TPA: hypothetical protein VG168_11980 [Bryobacteraceae bacterium]|nr:hypothetical protein [Bryobacteraceae bacterium]